MTTVVELALVRNDLSEPFRGYPHRPSPSSGTFEALVDTGFLYWDNLPAGTVVWNETPIDNTDFVEVDTMDFAGRAIKVVLHKDYLN